jgi:hypothetical protein
MTRDLLQIVRACLAGASTSSDDQVRAYYLGTARAALVELRDHARDLGRLLLAAEQDAARRGAPKEQLPIASDGSGGAP